MSRLFEAALRTRRDTPQQEVNSATGDLPTDERLGVLDGEQPPAPGLDAFGTEQSAPGRFNGKRHVVAPHPAARAAVAVAHAQPAVRMEQTLLVSLQQKIEDPRASEPDPATPDASIFSPDQLLTDKAWARMFGEYRRMAATLLQLQSDRGVRKLVVTSAVPSEGKSLTAANLAFTLTNVYRCRVLLIDGDMRRPMLHKIFESPLAPGLGECLHDGRLIESLPRQVRPGLNLLPAGRSSADPGSHLITAATRQFVAQLADHYDWVIIDTPPSAPLPDAELFAALVDLVVLVIRAGKTKYADVDRVITAIGRERIAGVVLNRMPPGSDPAHAYHNYADYYEDSQQESRRCAALRG
jgi:protein-tyrosine kinase